MEKLERRVEEMEVRISFQEDHIRQLDEVLQRQADLIDHLQNQLNALREQVSRDPGQTATPDEEVPPHW